MIEFVLIGIRRGGAPIYISCERGFPEIIKDIAGKYGAVILEDVSPFMGPAGGILSAISKIKDEDALIFTPVDMPFVDSEILRKLYESIRGEGIAVFSLNRSSMPLPVCIKGRALKTKVAGIIKQGERSLKKIYERVGGITEVEVPETCAFRFINVNTKEEGKTAEKMARFFHKNR